MKHCNLEPDDVYPEMTLLAYVKGTWEPADVFDTRELEDWAENNGFVKKE